MTFGRRPRNRVADAAPMDSPMLTVGLHGDLPPGIRGSFRKVPGRTIHNAKAVSA